MRSAAKPDMAQHPCSAHRCGIMLVEVSVAVALSSIVLGLVVSVAIALKQMDRRMQESGVARERLFELAELIRADIRQAKEVALPTEKSLLVATADGPVRYEIASEGVHRTVHSAAGDEGNKDLFALDAAQSWDIQRDEFGRRPLIMVTLNRGALAKPGRGKPIPFMVYAALGADWPAADQSSDVDRSE